MLLCVPEALRADVACLRPIGGRRLLQAKARETVPVPQNLA